MRYEKCLERLLKLTNMDMEKTNEIITIAGKRVRVVYDERNNYSCDGCCFAKEHSCQGLLETGKWPCEKYGVSSAYFVPAEEIANKPQTDANKNEPTREQKADFLQTNDVNKAAMDYYLNLPNSSYGEGGNLLPCAINEAFKAGIAWERERMMKDAPVADVIEMRGNNGPFMDYPFMFSLGFRKIPNIEYHGGKVRVIIEEIKD